MTTIRLPRLPAVADRRALAHAAALMTLDIGSGLRAHYGVGPITTRMDSGAPMGQGQPSSLSEIEVRPC